MPAVIASETSHARHRRASVVGGGTTGPSGTSVGWGEAAHSGRVLAFISPL